MPLRTVVQAVPQGPCRVIGNRPKIARPIRRRLARNLVSRPTCLIGVLVRSFVRVRTDETVRGDTPSDAVAWAALSLVPGIMGSRCP